MSISINQWRNDISTLSSLRTSLNDKLTICEGSFDLKKGEGRRRLGVPIIEDFHAVAEHLECLISAGRNYFKALKTTKTNTNDFYEEVANLKREVKQLYTSTSCIGHTYRVVDCNIPAYRKYYETYLFVQTLNLLNEIRNYKHSLQKPPLNQRPIKNIDYDERTELTSIKWSYPSRVPLEQTLATAKKAQALIRPKPLVQKMFAHLFKDFHANNIHELAFQRFSTQLLHCPFITENVAHAFGELADHAEFLDLKYAELASEDVTEFAPFINQDDNPQAPTLVCFLEAANQILKEQKFPMLPLKQVASYYNTYKDSYPFLSVDTNISPLEFLKQKKWFTETLASPTNSQINLRALKKLLNASLSSSTCRKIELSHSLLELKYVQDFINSNNYYFIKKNPNSGEFFRNA